MVCHRPASNKTIRIRLASEPRLPEPSGNPATFSLVLSAPVVSLDCARLIDFNEVRKSRWVIEHSLHRCCESPEPSQRPGPCQRLGGAGLVRWAYN